MAKDPNVSGIGSWLAFLILGMMVLSPLFGLGSLSGELRSATENHPQLAQNSQWQSYTNVAWFIFAASAATSFTAGYRLWKLHVPDSVIFAIRVIWIVGIGRPLIDATAAVIIFGINNTGKIVAETIIGMISAVIAAGIWTAYLKRSIRVKNTYGMLQ